MDVTYEVAGVGDPLLLVSGLGQPGKRWRRVVPLLADRFVVVTFDNRETGGTGPCEAGFTLQDIASDALELMTSLGHERFFVAGISMGGMITQEIIRLAPERIRAAALLSTHGGAAASVPPADPGVLLVPAADGTPAWARLAGPGFYEAHPDVIAEEMQLSLESTTHPMGYMRQLQAIQQFNPDAAIRDVGVPIVIAHGDTDPLVPYENGVQLAKALGVELVTFEGAGHVLECERVLELAELMKRVFSVR
jgi:pimeloyl-ACP methyl ester carboxylesterase